MLHGVGGNENDLFELAPHLDPRFYILSPRGPYKLGPEQYAWYERVFTPEGLKVTPEQAEESRKKLAKFIQEAIEHYEVDPARVFLMGFSQGAIMALALLLTAPENLAGVVSISGRILPELFQANSPLGNKLASTEALKGRLLFLGHGVQDEIVPIAHGRQAENLLMRAPIQMSYREYEMGHSISPQCLTELAIWLETQLA
jgi:phospholipase/carboxylesterase